MADNPQFPPNFKDTVEDTRNLVLGMLDKFAAVAGSAGNRWMDGFEKSDVEAVADDIGAKLKEQLVKAWDTAEANVTPKDDGGK
jgi:hypothetical protein